uniref:Phospholipase A2 activating protein n=1 Tax=Macaca fascicularis TaxID=9541 RepID=G7PS70_MACFA|nr:unnamed protein product [Macaca fascicularis]
MGNVLKPSDFQLSLYGAAVCSTMVTLWLVRVMALLECLQNQKIEQQVLKKSRLLKKSCLMQPLILKLAI